VPTSTPRAGAPRALVVEDDPAVREALAQALRDDGKVVEAVDDGEGFEAVVDGFRPDVVVLDVMLPGARDGFALGRALRGRSDAGLLFLTARDAVDDRLRGFSTGADDYVLKPYVTAELLARVNALLQRLGRAPSAVQVGDLVLDEAAQAASRAGVPLDLTGTEHRLLAYLVAQRGRTLSKTQILTQVWGYEDYDPNLVEVHVSALRRKTEAHGPRLIHTVRGLGYVLRP